MYEIFSYWIYIWFILYYFNLTIYNPLILLIIACIFTYIELLILIFQNISLYNGIKFFIVNTLIKIIPILLIINNKTSIEDIYISIYLIIIYLLTMHIFNISAYDYYKRMIDTFLNDDNDFVKLERIVKEYKPVLSILYDDIYNSFLNKNNKNT